MDAICIDLDNVIADTDPVLRRLIRERSQTGTDLHRRDVVCYEYWRCRDAQGRRITKDEFGLIHHHFLEGAASSVPLVPGAAAGLRQLGKSFEIHVATARPPHSKGVTRRWLDRNKIRYDRLHFVGTAGKQSIKEQFVFAVDDDREQAYAFLGRNVPVFLLAYPWNEIGPYSSITRVRHWPSLLSSIGRLKLSGSE